MLPEPARRARPKRRALAIPALLALAAPAAGWSENAPTSPWRWDDGLQYRGDGWNASLGVQVAADSGQRVDGTGNGGSSTVLRRARPSLQLALSPQWSARIEYEFGDVGAGWKNAWVQWRPSARTSVRFGSQFAPFGLENSMSSQSMPWAERSLASSLTSAALAGVSVRMHDDRWTLSGGVYGNDIADDDRRSFRGRSAIARGTFLPLRGAGNLWHVGASAEYRQGADGATLRLRARPETFVTDARLIDTGLLAGVDTLQTLGLETAFRRGPVLLQAEYLRSQAQRDALTGGDTSFDGGYVSASWFITGERRSYSESSGSFGGVKPSRGWGALEVAARASRLDLDDGSVAGGSEDNLSLSVNWYVADYGRVGLSWIDADAVDGLGVRTPRQYAMLRAQIAF